MQIIAVANQKGGVGKTTTAINLSAALAQRGVAVILVDLDAQANATTGLGLPRTDDAAGSYDLLVGTPPLRDIAQATGIAGLRVVGASADLSSADLEISGRPERLHLLRRALRGPRASGADADVVVIDCAPSLSLLTLNALVAADSVLIPLQSEYFALEGLTQLMTTIREVRTQQNPDLRIEGVLVTMHDRRNRLSQQVEQDVRDTLGGIVFDVVIPRNVRISEAPSHGLPITAYDPASRGSEAYRALADEIAARVARGAGHSASQEEQA
jgi:chromosome partitioning protein